MFKPKKDFQIDKTELINFVNLNGDELEKVRKMRNSKKNRDWMYSRHLITRKEHSEFVNDLRRDNANFFWVVKHKGRYIGVIYLNRVDFDNKNAYIGLYSNPETPGVGNILMDCLKKMAFNSMELHTLKLEVIEINNRAIAFYKKSHFKQEGCLEEFIYRDGTWANVIVMGVKNQKGKL
jgi:UDP-4-amino-4,6-dideoxy-N-acetyl-beta-L-altrosamine N-acetyltransferase